MAVSLHDLLSGDHFVDEGRLTAADQGLCLEVRVAAGSDEAGDKKGDRRQDKDQQR